MPIASRMPGTARSTSTTRISTLSTRPPAAPARAPTIPPIVRPMTTEITPTNRLIRAPNMTRLSSSRPCRSRPNQCAALGPGGGCRAGKRASGSYGAMIGANTATITNTPMRNIPSSAGRLRRSRRRASRHRPLLARGSIRVTAATVVISGVPDPRVEEGVADIHDEIHEEEDEGENEDHRLNDVVVMILDRLHDVLADAVPGKHRLRDHRACEQAAHLQPDDRRDGQPRIAHDVAVVHPPLAKALGPGRSNVVLVGDVQHRSPRDPGDDRERDGAQGNRRQYQVLEGIHQQIRAAGQEGVDDHEMGHAIEVHPGVEPTGGRQPPELDGEEELERVPQHEDRDRDPEQRDDRHQAVANALDVSCGQPPERDPQADREDQGRNCQLDRAREANRELADYRPIVDDALAQVTAEELAQVVQILDVERLIQAQVLADLRHPVGRGVLAAQRDRRVAGQQVDERKDDDGQAEQHRDRRQDPTDDVLQHGADIGLIACGSPGTSVPVEPLFAWSAGSLEPVDHRSSQTLKNGSLRLPAPRKPFTSAEAAAGGFEWTSGTSGRSLASWSWAFSQAAWAAASSGATAPASKSSNSALGPYANSGFGFPPSPGWKKAVLRKLSGPGQSQVQPRSHIGYLPTASSRR